jgi:hypothetical protein
MSKRFTKTLQKHPELAKMKLQMKEFDEDLDSNDIPRAGLSRLKRWNLADKQGLHPSTSILALLTRFPDFNSTFPAPKKSHHDVEPAKLRSLAEKKNSEDPERKNRMLIIKDYDDYLNTRVLPRDGFSRLSRWTLAERHNLNPPNAAEVKSLLEQHPELNIVFDVSKFVDYS